jgi:hypothetical protein
LVGPVTFGTIVCACEAKEKSELEKGSDPNSFLGKGKRPHFFDRKGKASEEKWSATVFESQLVANEKFSQPI